ncbi:MAG: glutamate--tRNA ligase [Asgard group archaeon]|nr:glutamate--tRNA ligase [Asgard group archaeon]
MTSDIKNPEELNNLILKYALENAIKYQGNAQKKAVMQRIMASHAKYRSNAKIVEGLVEKKIREVNQLPLKKQKEKLAKIAPELLKEEEKEYESQQELPPLEGTEKGNVITRYAPEPNGEMHLGHVFTAYFAHYYAQRYEGEFILRFEDTNPKQERKEYMVAHREALKWLKLPPDREVIVSNDMPLFYEKAEELINKNLAYTCSCSVEKMRNLRNEEKECQHAKKSPEVTLTEWKNMLADQYKEGEMVLRFRGDMNNKNAVMRDPVIFTIRKDSHCIQGEKYVVWPLYDFAVAIEDYHCGITHVGRSAEFDSRIELQNTLREKLDLLPHPRIFHYARYNVIGSPASKRKIKPLVEAGDVEGWDDIRLVTIKGLKRRGIVPETIHQLAEELGMTTQPTNIDWSLIEATNRKIIDPIANRYFFVPNPILLIISNAPHVKAKVPLHPDFPERGVKKILTGNFFLIPEVDIKQLKIGEEFRLKDLYNIRLDSEEQSIEDALAVCKPQIEITKPIKRFISKFTSCRLCSYTDEKLKPGLKIQWVPAEPQKVVKIAVKIPDVLYKGDKFNKKSLKIIKGYGEQSIKELSEGDIVQFERFGFVRIDNIKKEKIKVNLAHK